jgi:hypothetical protein
MNSDQHLRVLTEHVAELAKETDTPVELLNVEHSGGCGLVPHQHGWECCYNCPCHLGKNLHVRDKVLTYPLPAGA